MHKSSTIEYADHSVSLVLMVIIQCILAVLQMRQEKWPSISLDTSNSWCVTYATLSTIAWHAVKLANPRRNTQQPNAELDLALSHMHPQSLSVVVVSVAWTPMTSATFFFLGDTNARIHNKHFHIRSVGPIVPVPVPYVSLFAICLAVHFAFVCISTRAMTMQNNTTLDYVAVRSMMVACVALIIRMRISMQFTAIHHTHTHKHVRVNAFRLCVNSHTRLTNSAQATPVYMYRR